MSEEQNLDDASPDGEPPDPSGDPVSAWISQLKEADPAAAEELWNRFGSQFLQLARRRLHGDRRVRDEEDLAMSVFRSVCIGAADGRFDDLSDRDDLWRLAARITRNKAIDYARRDGAAKRGGGKVRGESVFVRSDGQSAGLDGFAELQHTPDVLVMMSEEIDRLLAALPDDVFREIARMKMLGHSTQEIGEAVELTTRSITRKLTIIRDTWEKELDDEG